MAEISEAILPLPDICVAALRLRAERQTATQDALRRLGQSLDWPTAAVAPVAARRSLKTGRDSQPAAELGGRYWDRTSDLLGVNEALSR